MVMTLFFGMAVHAQGDRVIQRMFLVGDAGELTNGHHPVCDWLKAHVDWNDSSNVLVYLGDNIYPQGMPSPGSKEYEEAKKIAQELRVWVAKEIGPIARPKDIRFGENLPKTRSGKIMRRLLRSIAKGEAITQDVSTLENPAILDQLKELS